MHQVGSYPGQQVVRPPRSSRQPLPSRPRQFHPEPLTDSDVNLTCPLRPGASVLSASRLERLAHRHGIGSTGNARSPTSSTKAQPSRGGTSPRRRVEVLMTQDPMQKFQRPDCAEEYEELGLEFRSPCVMSRCCDQARVREWDWASKLEFWQISRRRTPRALRTTRNNLGFSTGFSRRGTWDACRT